MRSDNLRAAPGWITPDMVKRVLNVAMPVEPVLVPVVPMPRIKPTLRIISERSSVPPSGGKIRSGKDGPKEKPRAASRQSSGAARAAPAESVSPTPIIEPTVAAASVEPPAAKHALLAGESGAALSCEVAQPRLDQPKSTRPYRRATSTSEVETLTVRQAVVPAPSREPAPSSPARAQPVDRARIDRANKAQVDAVRRRNMAKAEELLDAGKFATRGKGVHVVIAMRAVEAQRAEQARLSCPIEQAKSLLRRRYAPVCSMAVYDGDPDLFVVGSRRDVTRDELLKMAARIAA